MLYMIHYASPLGMLTLTSNESALTGVWFPNQKYYALPPDAVQKSCPILRQTERWLDTYFSGREPEYTPPLLQTGTEFRQAVWAMLLQIPYGTVVTYGQLAQRLAAQRGMKRMSARAVGGAVGHNPLGIIVPCHRVVGSGGNLTGFGGGIDAKVQLLTLEGVDMSKYHVPHV